MSAGVQLVLISFGHLHGPPPEADITVDVREVLPNPVVSDPAVLALTSLDPRVRDWVLASAGATEMTEQLARLAEVYLMLRTRPDDRGQYAYTSVAVGCGGGRHRSVAFVERLAVSLRGAGWWVEVEHRDVDKPLLRRLPQAAPARALPPGGTP